MVGGFLLLGLVWIAVTAALARNALDDLDNRIDRVRVLIAAGDIPAARKVADGIPAVAAYAHELTTGPAWWVAARVPYLGEPLQVARGVASSSGEVGTSVVPQLMAVAASLDPSSLRGPGTALKLAPLERAEPRLRAAATAVGRADDTVDRLPDSTWLSQVDAGRARIAATLHELRGYVDAAARVSRFLPGMLGSERTQRYFIGLQNEAELRGTGGLPGAFAIATARNGVLKFTDFESNVRLDSSTPRGLPTGLSFGPGYQDAYGASVPTSSFQNSNVSPHFPYAAQVWAAMWQKVSKQRIDGVIALDPTSLSYFLAAIGPATVPGGIVLTSQNVVSLLQRDQYSLFADDFERRKQFNVDVLRAASKKLEAGAGSGLALLQAATLSAQQQRLTAWSRDPAVERALTGTSYAGALPAPTVPFAAPVVNNASGGKLDYYLKRSFDYQRTGCGSTRDVVATVSLTNTAPTSGLPTYVTDRADTPPRGSVRGAVHEVLDYYASAGSRLLGVTVNGKPTVVDTKTDRGFAIFRFDVEIPPGQSRTFELHLEEPPLAGRTVIWRQPGVTPLTVTSRQQSCAGTG